VANENAHNAGDALWTIGDINRSVSKYKRWQRRRGQLSSLRVCKATEADGLPATNVLVGDDQPTRASSEITSVDT
jgi:hypothetical protein